MSLICPSEFVDLAHQMVTAARPEIISRYRVKIPVESKADSSPVTEADRAAEAAMRRLIEEHYPDHGIIGEEFGSVRTDSDYVWVLDPVDGTKSFITGLPLFATLIALTYKGRPVLGVADQAVLQETWMAGDGVPATLNGAAIEPRKCSSLDQAIAFTTGLEYWPVDHRPKLAALSDQVSLMRMGADCYGFLQVANGFADIAIEMGVNAFDVMALVPILQQSGARITDFKGNPVDLTFDGSVVACGDPGLHNSVLEVLNGV